MAIMLSGTPMQPHDITSVFHTLLSTNNNVAGCVGLVVHYGAKRLTEMNLHLLCSAEDLLLSYPDLFKPIPTRIPLNGI